MEGLFTTYTKNYYGGNKMSGMNVLKQFGFHTEEEPVSIYPFSPVYRVRGEEKELIVKKTQRPIERALRLMKYTATLKENGINIVTPTKLTMANPQTIGDHTYVAYPFIEGLTYSGTEEEIIEAGELLGEIHALSPTENLFDLEEYNVFDFNIEEVTKSVQKIEKNAATYPIKIENDRLKEKLLQFVTQQEELQNCRLTYITTPHDFKANNLIYMPKPYLIDPDNAIWIPRIFDLALA